MDRAAAAALTLLASLTILAGCGGGGDDGGAGDDGGGGDGGDMGTGSVSLNVIAINAGAGPAFARVSPSAAAASRTIDPSTYRAWSITSGPADEVRIYVKRIEARRGEGGDSTREVLFSASSEPGAEVVLSAGAVDLAESGIVLAPIQTGSYDTLALTLSRVGKFKGCVSDVWRANSTNTGPFTGEPLHAGNTYTSETLVAGTHGFCTIASRSQFAAETFSTDLIGSNAEFEAQATPELVEFDLSGGNGEALTAEEIRAASVELSFPIVFAVSDTGPALTLTAAFDLNRQLRYFANTRDDFNPPQPAMKTGTSYFFTTFFRQSFSVFAGIPGSIEGYPVDVEACVGTSCVPNTLIRAWMTLIKGADSSVLAGGAIPDDDNGLTVFKGEVDPAGVGPGTSAGTVRLPLGLGSDGTCTLTDFTYLGITDPETSANLDPLQEFQDFNVFYHREL